VLNRGCETHVLMTLKCGGKYVTSAPLKKRRTQLEADFQFKGNLPAVQVRKVLTLDQFA